MSKTTKKPAKKPAKKALGSVEKPQAKPQAKKAELTNAAKREKGIDQIGYLGGKLVVEITKRTINEVEYNNVVLLDGTGYLLSDRDLKAQLKNK